MTRLQEVEKLLDNDLQLITDYTKRAAELIGSVRQLEKERDKLTKKNRGLEVVRCKDCVKLNRHDFLLWQRRVEGGLTMTDTDMLYMASLEKKNNDLEAKVAELEDKHWNECRQIAHYSDENAKLKELMRKAVEVINREISSFTTCEECNMYDEETTECNGNAMDRCSEIGKWRYADEALALIGEDTNVPASKDGDTNG